MSQRDDRLPMHHMLEHAREATQIIAKYRRTDLESNQLLRLALRLLVQVVGEAATRVSAAGQAAHPDIPWTQAIATRHRMVHHYDRIDYNVVWDTVAEDFPPLVAALERALGVDPDNGR